MNVLDLLEELGIEPKRAALCGGGEYHSRCPHPLCEGVDRFCVWPKEGSNGRYWCRQCLRVGDAIQFCRDFMGMDFHSACAKVGRQPALSTPRIMANVKKRFTPKVSMTPKELWSQQALKFVQQCYQYLLRHLHLLNQDKDRGLTQQEIIDFQLGWNPVKEFIDRKVWGLPDSSESGGTSVLCLPKGIVIPSFLNNEVNRIKIRRDEWRPEDKFPKYHIVVGGTTSPSLYGDPKKPLVIVEAELDAMLVQRFAKDLCCCIALGGVSIRPDTVTDQLLRSSSYVLFALDFDDSGKKAYHFWKEAYAHIEPWPVPKGKSPGDAYLLGVDIRQWVENGLKKVIKRKESS